MDWLAYAFAWGFLSIFGGLFVGAFIQAANGRDDDSTYGADEGRWPK